MKIVVRYTINNFNLPETKPETHYARQYTLVTRPDLSGGELTAGQYYADSTDVLVAVDGIPAVETPCQNGRPNVLSYVGSYQWYVRPEDEAEYAALLAEKQAKWQQHMDKLINLSFDDDE